MFSSSEKERIVIEVGAGLTKVLIGTSYGKRKRGVAGGESLLIKDTFTIKTPKVKMPESATSTYSDLENAFIPGFDKMELIKEISEKLRQRKVKGEEVIISVGDHSVVSREMTLPKVEEAKLKGIVSYELQEFLPIDPKQYLIDFKVIDEVKVGELDKYKLIVAALPKKEGQFYHEFVQELGKDPFALDLTSNAISKLFDRNIKINGKLREVEKETYAYVDIGDASINLHILENGVLKFTRTIEGGVHSISGEYEDKIRESEESTAFITKWIGSLEQMFKFYTSREMNRRIDHIFLYGGGTLIPNIDKKFTDLTGVPAEIIKEIENVELHKDCAYFPLPLFLNAAASLIRR